MKRLGYFAILTVCVLLLAQNAGGQTEMKNTVIGIKYVGPSDKPITPIVIAQSQEDADLFKETVLKMSDLEITDVHVVSSALMAELVATVESIHEGSAKKRGSQANAAVLLTVVIHDQTTSTHLGRSDGIKALGRLANITKGCPALEADIAHFKTRITAFGPGADDNSQPR